VVFDAARPAAALKEVVEQEIGATAPNPPVKARTAMTTGQNTTARLRKGPMTASVSPMSRNGRPTLKPVTVPNATRTTTTAQLASGSHAALAVEPLDRRETVFRRAPESGLHRHGYGGHPADDADDKPDQGDHAEHHTYV